MIPERLISEDIIEQIRADPVFADNHAAIRTALASFVDAYTEWMATRRDPVPSEVRYRIHPLIIALLGPREIISLLGPRATFVEAPLPIASRQTGWWIEAHLEDQEQQEWLT